MKKFYLKTFRALIVASFVFFSANSVYSQTTIFSEGFENADGFSLEGALGTVAVGNNNWRSTAAANKNENNWSGFSSGGYNITNRSLMISAADNNSTQYPGQYFTHVLTDKHAYSSVSATGYTSLILDFDWRCAGERSGTNYYDFGQVAYRLGTTGAWTYITTGGYAGGNYVSTSAVTHAKINLPSAVNNTTFQLAFTWKSDKSSGTAPAFVIDNIKITATPISTNRTLTVANAYTGASYANGANTIANNTNVTATSGTRTGYNVTGWTGTGSVPATGTGGSANFTITQNSTITWNWQQIGLPNNLTFFDYGGAQQLAFNNSRQNTTTPTFRLSHTTDPATDYQIEINTNPTFAGGTSWVQTFTGMYPATTQGNFVFNNNFTPTTNTTYYVRARAKGAASVYSAWTTATYSFTYDSSFAVSNWFQTTQTQFLTDALSGVQADINNDVSAVSSGGNVVLNPSFENGMVNWTVIRPGNWYTVASEPYGNTDGVNSLNIYNNSPNSFGYFVNEAAGAYQSINLTGVSNVSFRAGYQASAGSPLIVQCRVYISETSETGATSGMLVKTWTPPSTLSTGNLIDIDLSSYNFTGNKLIKFIYFVTSQEFSYNERYLYIDDIKAVAVPQGSATSTPIYLSSVQGVTKYQKFRWNQTLGGGNLNFKIQQTTLGGNTWTDVPGYTNISATGDGQKEIDLSTMTAYPQIRLVANLNGANVKLHDWSVLFEETCKPVVATTTKNIICPGETVTLSATTTGTGYSYTWYTNFDNNTNSGQIVNGPSPNPSFDIIPTQSTIYTVVARKTGCTEKSIIVVVVTSAPTAITVDPISAVACSGEIIKMSVTSGGIIPPTILDSNFNSASSTVWSTSSETIPNHPTPRIANWSYWLPTYPNNYGNADGSIFVKIDAYSVGPGYKILNSNLISPPLSFGDYSAVTMTYQHHFSNQTGANGILQISEDGGENWVDLKTYNSSTSGFVNESLSLTPYAGKLYVILRFKFSGPYAQNNFWAVDNIKITGVALPSTVTWSPTTGLFTDLGGSTAYMGGNATTVFASPTATTTYTVSAKTAVGCPSTQTIVVTKGNKDWAGTTDVNWNTATNWEANVVPTADYCVNIPNMANKPIIQVGTNALAKNLTIQHGGSLLIKGNLSVTDFIRNKGAAENLIVESDANLIQINPLAANEGSIVAKRDLKFSEDRQQYNYLISPVKNMRLKDIYKDGTGNPVNVPFVLYHNEANNKFYNSTGAYIAGRALAVKEATNATFGANTMSATFTGEPMNGTFDYALINSSPGNSERGFNLIGNPYPSNFDLNAFYGDNVADLSPTFNFWDSTANNTYIQAGDIYPGQAYAQWNVTTPPGTGSGTKATGDITGTKEPTKFVKVGQGFMAKSLTAAKKVTFKNTMRSTGVSQGFFGKDAVPFDRYYLNMTSPLNITAQSAVVYFAGGDDAFTNDDSRSLGGSDAIYSTVDDQQVSINGKNSFVNTDVVPLGSNHFAGGNYTIALGHQKDGVFANGQDIYLKDKQTGIVTNLSQGNYVFAAITGESIGRFEIIYLPQTVLVTDAKVKENLAVYRDRHDFVVKSQTINISTVEVYDAAGRLLLHLSPYSKEVRLDGSNLVNGIYVLKINQNGKVTTKKVLR